MRALFVKHFQSLRPADEQAEEMLRGLKQGQVVQAEIKQPRNVKFHRLFFALCDVVKEQRPDEYPTVETVVTELKIATKHYTKRILEAGGEKYAFLTPKSISFSAMDEIEFGAFFERCADWVVTNILPGVKAEDVRNEIEIMTGIKI